MYITPKTPPENQFFLDIKDNISGQAPGLYAGDFHG